MITLSSCPDQVTSKILSKIQRIACTNFSPSKPGSFSTGFAINLGGWLPLFQAQLSLGKTPGYHLKKPSETRDEKQSHSEMSEQLPARV